LTILTPIAAVGLAVAMVLAAIYHMTWQEYPNIVLNLVLVAFTAFIAYGRFVLFPF
jgi:putative oxidoreductase